MHVSKSCRCCCFSILFLAVTLLSCNTFMGRQSADAEIYMDGSSTVFPLSEAAAEEYHLRHTDSRILIGISGTLNGFTLFSKNQLDITDASRLMLPAEDAVCKKNHVDYFALPLCTDEVAVLVNKANTWVDYFSLSELQLIWSPASQGEINYWDDVRPAWPHKPIHLYSPGPASGTFEFFTELVNGKARLSREDVTPSFNPERLIQNLSSDPNGLAYFGYIYYNHNQKMLKQVPVYHLASRNPLSRVLYLYVSKASLDKPAFRDFMVFYLEMLPLLIRETGYISLSESGHQLQPLASLAWLPKPGCSRQELEHYLASYQLISPSPR